jgi:hypothetical protein
MGCLPMLPAAPALPFLATGNRFRADTVSESSARFELKSGCLNRSLAPSPPIGQQRPDELDRKKIGGEPEVDQLADLKKPWNL